MIPFIIAGALIAGAIALTLFWKEIKSFIQASWARIQQIIVPSLIAGFKTYLKTKSLTASIGYGVLVGVQKFYSKTERNQWKETVITREIPPDELPKDIRMKLERSGGKEVDITNEVSRELKLEN